jgi:hypothetical protein
MDSKKKLSTKHIRQMSMNKMPKVSYSNNIKNEPIKEEG